MPDSPAATIRVHTLRYEGELLPIPEYDLKIEFIGDSLTSGIDSHQSQLLASSGSNVIIAIPRSKAGNDFARKNGSRSTSGDLVLPAFAGFQRITANGQRSIASRSASGRIDGQAGQTIDVKIDMKTGKEIQGE